MKAYQVHPQVNGGLRTITPANIAVGGVSKRPTGKVTIPEVTDLMYWRFMKHRIVFYPTLYKSVVIHTPPTNRKCGTLTAYYSHGVGGFDLRPFVLEIMETE